jgi:hypothetical protein
LLILDSIGDGLNILTIKQVNSMISLIFFILASICNSIMDTLCHHHSTSIFKKHITGFWSDSILQSWKNKYANGDPLQGRKKLFWIINVPVQFTDAFHFFKSLMIIFTCLSIATFWLNEIYFFDYWINVLIVIIIYGTAWNATFSLFYNKILRRR